MGEVTLPGVPQPKQIEFFLADTQHIGYGGAKGGGKSWALRRKMVLRRLKYPGSKGLLLRRTFPELLGNHVLPLQAELRSKQSEPLARYNSQEHTFTFVNGSILFLGYCDAEADVLRYQGQEFDDIGLEEATLFTEFQRDYLTSCLRTTRTDLQPRMYYTGNPGGPGHLWFKRLFIDRQYDPDKQERAEDYTFIPAKVYDNQVLLKADPSYLRRLQALPEDLRRAYLEGDWDVFAGQYFKSFRRDIHVIRPFEIPSWWRRFRSLDYGLDCTACYWWAVDPEGKCYIYREVYEHGLTLSQAAKAVLAATPEGEPVEYTVASPDLWNRRQETGQSGQEIMYYAGLKDLTSADNNRIPGWRVLNEYVEPYDDPNTDAKTAKLLISETCRNLIRTLPALVRDDHNPEDVSDKGEDHGPESIRYGIMSRPRKAKELLPDKAPIASFKDELARKAQRLRRRPA